MCMSVNEQGGHSSGSGHSSMHCKRPEAQRDFTSLVLAWHVIMGMVIRRRRHQHDLIFRSKAGKTVCLKCFLKYEIILMQALEVTELGFLGGRYIEIWLKAIWNNIRVSLVITGLKKIPFEELSLKFYSFPGCLWTAVRNSCARGSFAQAGFPVSVAVSVLANSACFQLVWVPEVSIYLFRKKKKKVIPGKTYIKEWAYISSQVCVKWDFILVGVQSWEARKMLYQVISLYQI